MPTRRSFLAATAALVAVDFMPTDGAIGSPTATPAPVASPKPPPPPSATARCMAKHLQKTLPEAKLSDAMTEKIAGDIDGFLGFGKSFRAKKLQNSDEPDFIFTAVEGVVR